MPESIIKLKRLREWTPVLTGGLAGLLLGGAGSGGIAPLGPAFAAAMFMAELPTRAAALGAAAGALLFGHTPQGVLALCYGMGAELLRRRRTSPLDKLLLLVVLGVTVLPWFYWQSLSKAMTGLSELVLTLGAAVVMRHGLTGLKKLGAPGRTVSDAEQASLCALAAFMVYGFRDWTVGGIYLGGTLAAFFALCAARAKGVTAVAAAVMLSSACVLSGSSMELVGGLCVCTLAACALRPLGKWGAVFGFLASAFAARYYLGERSLSLWGCALASGGFALIPGRYFLRLDLDGRRYARSAAERKLAFMQSRLSMAADVIRQLSGLFAADAFAGRQLKGVADALLNIGGEGVKRQRRYDVRVGAAACAKPGSAKTGDSMGVRQVNGKLLLLLSDGMGSGEEAHGESAAAVAMLGDLLCIGYGLPEALECVNRMLMLRAESDMFATLDALLIDLHDASAQFIKYGAPPDCILREGKVRVLYASALPAGIVAEARPALHTANLRRGDAVALMTDGVFDALGSGVIAAMWEKVGAANTPDDAARALLAAAREKSGADDMSVIVARIV